MVVADVQKVQHHRKARLAKACKTYGFVEMVEAGVHAVQCPPSLLQAPASKAGFLFCPGRSNQLGRISGPYSASGQRISRGQSQVPQVLQ